MLTLRLRRRLLAHHLPLLMGSGTAIVLLYVTRPYPDVVSRASFATAYPALALLSATLLIGPWQVMRRRPNPISTDVRRDVGIWAGILGIAHTAVGQCVHLRGRPWLYYIYGPTEHHAFPIRHDLFGFANYTGALAVVVLAGLLATSNDYCLRWLGTPRWKQLQRWNYALFALTAMHAFGYQGIEKQRTGYVLTVLVWVVITAGFQGLGWVKRKRAKAAPGAAPGRTTG